MGYAEFSTNLHLALTDRRKYIIGTMARACKRSMLPCAVVLSFAASVFSQNPDQGVAAARQATAENKQKLEQYHWIETTQLTLKGDEKPPTRNSCQYGPSGQIEKTPLGSPPEPPSGGRLKQKVVEKKKGEMQDYMDGVKSVLAMYVPPDSERIQQAYQAGNAALNPVPGALNLVFTNYAQPGDKMTLTFDTAAKKISHLTVDTYMGEAKDAVTLQVQMGSLPDGTNYPQQSVLNASAKKLTVTTTNSNYQKR